MPGGILALLAGAKDASSDADKGETDEAPERGYAREAFSAMKDGDEDGFIEAFISAVKACSKKAEGDEYGDESEGMMPPMRKGSTDEE